MEKILAKSWYNNTSTHVRNEERKHFSRADGCNKLKSILFSYTFYAFCTKKKKEKRACNIHALTENKEGKTNAKDIIKERARRLLVFQIEWQRELMRRFSNGKKRPWRGFLI